MSKPTKKRQNRKSNAAEEAETGSIVQEAMRNFAPEPEEAQEFDSPEERDQYEADSVFSRETPHEVDAKDIFYDALIKARAKNTSPKFRIYRDGDLVGMKEGQYSWEKLREEFGGGFFKINAVDKSNLFLGTQVQSVAAPPNWNQPQNSQTQPQSFGEKAPNTFETLELIKESSREAKAEVAAQSASQTNAMAVMMQAMAQSQQAMFQMQQQSSQQFQTLLVEMQKQTTQAQTQASQQMMTLFTTMLSNKKGDDGFTPASVMKMVEEARRDGKNDTKDWYKLLDEKVEKKVEEHEELIASQDSGEKESVLQTALKGFLPILSAQMESAKAAQSQNAENQVMVPQVPAPGTIRPGSGPQYTPEQLAEIRRRTSGEGRPATVAPSRVVTPQAEPVRVAANPQVIPPAGASASPVPVVAPQTTKIVNPQPGARQMNGSAEPLRQKIFEIVASDIGVALIGRKSASKCAEVCLKKLETHGIQRQTIVEVFSFEDFIRYAYQNGVPELALPWLKDFHETVQKSVILGDGKSTQPGTEPRATT